jgi:mono/diheme cytochrome c family protein
MQNPGSILVFTYTGEAPAADADETEPPDSAAEEDIAVATAEGAAISFTPEQAARGEAAYTSNCVSCHSPTLLSPTYGTPLAGPYFEGKWAGKTVGALFTYTHDRMPPSRPGTLDDQTYADIVAYILQVNGVPPGETELPTDIEELEAMPIVLGEGT